MDFLWQPRFKKTNRLESRERFVFITDESFCRSILEYQNQAKRLFKTLSDNSPQRCSIETGNGQYIFQWVKKYLLTDEADRGDWRSSVYVIFAVTSSSSSPASSPWLRCTSARKPPMPSLMISPRWCPSLLHSYLLFGAIFIPRSLFRKMQIAEILSTGVSQPVWSQNQHSNPALLLHRVWHIHTGRCRVNIKLRKARTVNYGYHRKQRRPTVTAEGGEIWTTWTLSYKMSRG